MTIQISGLSVAEVSDIVNSLRDDAAQLRRTADLPHLIMNELRRGWRDKSYHLDKLADRIAHDVLGAR